MLRFWRLGHTKITSKLHEREHDSDRTTHRKEETSKTKQRYSLHIPPPPWITSAETTKTAASRAQPPPPQQQPPKPPPPPPRSLPMALSACLLPAPRSDGNQNLLGPTAEARSHLNLPSPRGTVLVRPDTLHAREHGDGGRVGGDGAAAAECGARGGKRFGAETGPGKHKWGGRAGGAERARTRKRNCTKPTSERPVKQSTHRAVSGV
jgi:hypothetical protein